LDVDDSKKSLQIPVEIFNPKNKNMIKSAICFDFVAFRIETPLLLYGYQYYIFFETYKYHMIKIFSLYVVLPPSACYLLFYSTIRRIVYGCKTPAFRSNMVSKKSDIAVRQA
jgi:hypothetical protein